MKSICFLAANLQLKEKIEQVLTIATSQEQQTAIPFHVEVLNFPQRIEQAQKAIAQGADVIITNTGAHHDLSQVLKDVPILCLHYSTNDLLYVLSKLRYYEKIHVMLNQNIIINAAMCPAELIPKIEFHRYHTDISTEKLASIVNSITTYRHRQLYAFAAIHTHLAAYVSHHARRVSHSFSLPICPRYNFINRTRKKSSLPPFFYSRQCR